MQAPKNEHCRGIIQCAVCFENFSRVENKVTGTQQISGNLNAGRNIN